MTATSRRTSHTTSQLNPGSSRLSGVEPDRTNIKLNNSTWTETETEGREERKVKFTPSVSQSVTWEKVFNEMTERSEEE